MGEAVTVSRDLIFVALIFAAVGVIAIGCMALVVFSPGNRHDR